MDWSKMGADGSFRDQGMFAQRAASLSRLNRRFTFKSPACRCFKMSTFMFLIPPLSGFWLFSVFNSLMWEYVLFMEVKGAEVRRFASAE